MSVMPAGTCASRILTGREVDRSVVRPPEDAPLGERSVEKWTIRPSFDRAKAGSSRERSIRRPRRSAFAARAPIGARVQGIEVEGDQ
jgi:hypothetical protein